MHRHRAGERRTFRQCFEQELAGTETRFRKRFINQSLYAPHLERWFGRFPRENFLILRAEDLFANATAVAGRVFEFLDLPAFAAVSEAENVGVYAESLEAETCGRLADYFRPHNQRLYTLLGQDLGWE